MTPYELIKLAPAADVAELVGVSVQAVYAWKRGDSQPQPRHVERLWWVLDVIVTAQRIKALAN